MKITQSIYNWLAVTVGSLKTPHASAHQVKELTPEDTVGGLSNRNPEFTLSIQENLNEVLFWSFTSITIVSIVLLVSIIRKFEEWFDPILHRIKKFAPFIMQITLGVALLLSAIYGSLFGAELPLEVVFGNYAGVSQVGLAIAAGMLLAGIMPRLVAMIVIAMFVPLFFEHGLYTINYLTHFGEAITIFLLGGTYQITQSDVPLLPKLYRSMELHLHKYKFLILRFFLGSSLVFASLHAKYLHGDLALKTLMESNLIEIFPFDPTFLVIGALIIEILLGIFFIIGFEVRFAAVSYIIFLIVSIIYFQEAVWPHIILIGTCLAMFTHGYDRYTIGGTLLKRGNLEPIL